MALLDGLEKLIIEHGSSQILRERIALANDRYALLEEKVRMLEAKVKELESKVEELETENETLRLNLEQAQQQITVYKKELDFFHDSNPDGYVCDHCGSRSLRRTGSRPDPTFGPLGVKQKVFICNDCGKESLFTDG